MKTRRIANVSPRIKSPDGVINEAGAARTPASRDKDVHSNRQILLKRKAFEAALAAPRAPEILAAVEALQEQGLRIAQVVRIAVVPKAPPVVAVPIAVPKANPGCGPVSKVDLQMRP